MPDHFTFEDDDKAGASPKGFSWEEDNGPAQRAAALARNAQPTEFEKARADASNTPALDTLKGFGEGLLDAPTLIGRGIHAIPKVGPMIVPSQGLGAEQKLATARTPGEHLGKTIEGVAEAALPIGEAVDAVKGSRFIRPAARFLSENVIPEIKALPYVGRGIEAAERAPNFVKAAIRGGTTGATLGALEQAIRTRDLGETVKGALYGGAGGALFGMGAHGINRLANRVPTVAETWEPSQPVEIPSVRRGPGEIAPESVGAPPERLPLNAMHPPTVELPAGGTMRGPQPLLPAVGETTQAAGTPRMPAVSPLSRLEGLIQEAAGTRPLQPAVPLRSQLPQSVGAAAEGFPRVGDVPANMGGKVTFRREPITKTVPGLEEGPLRAKAPEGLPTVATEEPMRQMGAPPLQPAVPLREQLKPTGMEPASKQVTLEQKYPDREVRQLVHANGEEMIDAIGEDRETMKAVHDLKNTDVRQALINSGEDMGQTSIGNRKATGDQITRQDAFKKLLAKGYSPKQIVDLAHQEMQEAGAGKPGPIRAAIKPAREKAGD